MRKPRRLLVTAVLICTMVLTLGGCSPKSDEEPSVGSDTFYDIDIRVLEPRDGGIFMAEVLNAKDTDDLKAGDEVEVNAYGELFSGYQEHDLLRIRVPDLRLPLSPISAQRIDENGTVLDETDADKPIPEELRPVTEPDTLQGIGTELLYADESFIVFMGSYGLFGYDLDAQEITFGIDLNASIGTDIYQGDVAKMVQVAISADGALVQLRSTDGTSDTYYINTREGTCHTGDYEPLREPFDRETLRDGHLGTLENLGSPLTLDKLYFQRGVTVWMLFSKSA